MKLKMPKKSTILTIAACAGVVGTGIGTYIATRKSEDTLNDKNLSKTEKIKRVAPKFLTPVGVGAGTIACIITNNYQNRKQIKTLAAAYVSMSELFNSYRREVISEKGEEFDKKCYNKALNNTKYPNVYTDETILLKDEYSGDIIETTLYEIEIAKRKCIESYVDLDTGGRLDLNSFRWLFGYDWKPEYVDYGWCMDNGVYPISFKPEIYDPEEGVWILSTYDKPYSIPPDIH